MSLARTAIAASSSTSRIVLPRIARRTFIASTCRHATESSSASTSSSAPSPAPSTSSAAASSTSSKVNGIVDAIAGLSLLEAADLVQALKTRLNIADIPMAAAAAPGPSAASAPAEAAAAPEPVKEKTAFKVVLKKIDAAQKAKAIKEVKAAMAGMNLVEAKKFVESVPQTLKENATKEEADKLKEALTKVGAEVSVE